MSRSIIPLFPVIPATPKSIGKRGLILGVGVNDAPYVISPAANGGRVTCKFYSTWHSMLQRCYDKKVLKKRPQYIGCKVDARWHKFTAFMSWMKTQDWENKALDKDILVDGNKIYSPETCVFVTQSLNNLLTGCRKVPGKLPPGVSFSKANKKFKVQCGDGAGGDIFLGYHETAEEAFNAWRACKKKVILEAANGQEDEKIKVALIARANQL